jgi:hypothetical protein
MPQDRLPHEFGKRNPPATDRAKVGSSAPLSFRRAIVSSLATSVPVQTSRTRSPRSSEMR